MHPRRTSWSFGCVQPSAFSLVLAAVAVGVPFRLAACAGVSRAQAAAAWAGPGQMSSALSSDQQSYDEAFAELAARFRKEGWEARQEDPPQAYLHVSKPGWKDTSMNGIHFETYVLAGQLKSGFAPVMLHCERGFPQQAEFMHAFTHKARAPWRRSDTKCRARLDAACVRSRFRLDWMPWLPLMHWKPS